MTKLRSSKRLNRSRSTSNNDLSQKSAEKKPKKEHNTPSKKQSKKLSKSKNDLNKSEDQFNDDSYLDDDYNNSSVDNEEKQEIVEESIDINICLSNIDDLSSNKLYIQCKCNTPLRIIDKFLYIKLKDFYILNENSKNFELYLYICENNRQNLTDYNLNIQDLLKKIVNNDDNLIVNINYKVLQPKNDHKKVDSLEQSQIKGESVDVKLTERPQSRANLNRPLIKHEVLINGQLGQNTPPPSPLMRTQLNQSRPSSNSSAFQAPITKDQPTNIQQQQQQQQQQLLWNAYLQQQQQSQAQNPIAYQQWQYHYAAMMYQQQVYENQLRLQQQNSNNQSDQISIDLSKNSTLQRPASAFIAVQKQSEQSQIQTINTQQQSNKRYSDPLALNDLNSNSEAKPKRAC